MSDHHGYCPRCDAPVREDVSADGQHHRAVCAACGWQMTIARDSEALRR
jgi:uncharacterized paraquat-inducible protein A